MKKMTVEREVWQAKDGTEFDTERDCQIHELAVLHRHKDLRFTRQLLDLLKEHKQEIFEVMGWDEKGPDDLGVIRLCSLVGGISQPNACNRYEYMLNWKKGMRYSGTLCFSDGVTEHSINLNNIHQLQLIINEGDVA